MATIRKRLTKTGEARYYVEIRIKGAPPVRRSFRRRAGAKAWAARVEASIQEGRLVKRLDAESHTLSEAIDRYLAHHVSERTHNPRGLVNRQSTLEFWRHHLGRLPLNQVTPAAIGEVRNGLKVSGSTINRYLTALSAVLTLAEREWEWIDQNPVSRVARARENPPRARFLSVDEKDRLLAAARDDQDPRIYPLILFAITTGARSGELMGLRWADVDLTSGPPFAILEHTKNGDRRTLTLAEPAGTVLREMAKNRHITGFLFASRKRRHKRGLKPHAPQEAWRRVVAAAEIDDFRFHDLRHTAASYLAMSGATLAEIAAFLGHRTLAMVKRYAHLTEQHSAKVTQRMAERFLADSPPP